MPTRGDTILAVLWLGILGSFIAYVLYFFLIERLGATMSSMVTYLFPVVGVGIGVLLLGERLDVRLAVGTLLVLIGIAVVSLRFDPRFGRLRREASR